MEEGIKVSITDVLNIIEDVTEHFYKKLQFGEITNDDFLMSTIVCSYVIKQLEGLAEETDETDG